MTVPLLRSGEPGGTVRKPDFTRRSDCRYNPAEISATGVRALYLKVDVTGLSN